MSTEEVKDHFLELKNTPSAASGKDIRKDTDELKIYA